MRKVLLCIVLVLLLFIVSACMSRQQGFEHNLEKLLSDYNYTDDELIEYLKERGSLDIFDSYESMRDDFYSVCEEAHLMDNFMADDYYDIYDHFSDYFSHINRISRQYFPDDF